MTKLVSIGNGLYCRTAKGESVIERYFAKQKSCAHVARDPKGKCRECGHESK